MRKYFSLSFFRKNVFYLIFILLALIPLIWFKNGLLIAGGDNSFSYLGLEKKFNLPFTWDSRYANLGFYTKTLHHLIYSNLANILDFIPDPVFQMLLFSALFFFRLLIYYKLLSLLFNNGKNKNLFFPAILLFALNPYLLIDPISLIGFLVPIQMCLIFIFVYKFLNQNKIDFKYLILISITNSLLFSNIAALFATYIPGSLYFIFNFLFARKKLNGFLKRIFCVGLIFTGLNLWYLIPMVKSFLETSGIGSIVNPFRATEAGYLYDHFRLIGQWGWYEKHFLYPYFSFAKNYYKFPLIFSTYGITLLALLPLLFLPLKTIFKNNERKTFYFFVFLFLLGLTLANGGKPPLGRIYMAIFNSISIFWMFREPWTKFTPLMVFSLPVLLYGSLLYLRQKIRNSHLQKVLYGIVVAMIIINVYPIFTGEVIWDNWNGSMRSFRVKIPQYWQEMKEYLINNNLQEERLLTFPASGYGMTYNWRHGLSSADDVAVYLLPNPIVRYSSYPLNNSDLLVNQLFDKLPDKNFNLKNYLSLLNTKYILQENDVDWRYSNKALSPSKSNKVLADNDFRLIESFGFFNKEYLFQIPNEEPDERLHNELYRELSDNPALTLYEIGDKYFLPHFYTPQNVIYSNGDIKSMVDMISFWDYEIRSGMYFSDIVNDTKRSTDKAEKDADNVEVQRTLMGRADEIFVNGELKSKVNKEGLSGIVAPDEEDVFFPYVRWKPGSLIYPLILKKEQFDEWKVRKSTEKLLDKKLFYASKRISEMEKWGREMDLDKDFERYKDKMEEAIWLLKETSWQNEEVRLQNVLTFQTNLDAHWQKMKGLGFNKNREEKLEKIFDQLKEDISDLKKEYDFSRLVYNFEIPEDGNYQLFIKNEEFSRYLKDTQLNLEVLGKKIIIPFQPEAKEWINGGSFKLEKGEQELKLDRPQATNLLSAGDWQSNLRESIFVKEGLISPTHLQLALPEGSTVYFKPIDNYQGDKSYKISFDYFASGGEAGIVLMEDIGIEKRGLKVKEALPSTDIDSPRHFEKNIKSTPGAKTAEFYFWGETETNEDSKIKFFNVKVERVFEPTIIFHTTQPQKSLQMPKITFVKINPTKYRVRIEGAKEPYTLIFSESFHKGWKAYISDQWSVTGDQQYGEVVASYFDGEIKEGTNRNIFLDRNTFETWGKKSLSEDKHLLVNGYANSWYITPEDSGGLEDYELVVEFQPQRLFYIGLGISLMTLLGCLGYLGYDLTKRKVENRNERN